MARLESELNQTNKQYVDIPDTSIRVVETTDGSPSTLQLYLPVSFLLALSIINWYENLRLELYCKVGGPTTGGFMLSLWCQMMSGGGSLSMKLQDNVTVIFVLYTTSLEIVKFSTTHLALGTKKKQNYKIKWSLYRELQRRSKCGFSPQYGSYCSTKPYVIGTQKIVSRRRFFWVPTT